MNSKRTTDLIVTRQIAENMQMLIEEFHNVHFGSVELERLNKKIVDELIAEAINVSKISRMETLLENEQNVSAQSVDANDETLSPLQCWLLQYGRWLDQEQFNAVNERLSLDPSMAESEEFKDQEGDKLLGQIDGSNFLINYEIDLKKGQLKIIRSNIIGKYLFNEDEETVNSTLPSEKGEIGYGIPTTWLKLE